MPVAGPTRALLGFVAAAISVLTFDQGMVALLHAAGLIPTGAYPVSPVRPFGVPMIAGLCFWGGLYGALFGLVLPWLRWPLWLCGLIMGSLSVLIGWFVLAPLKGLPLAGGFHAVNMARMLLVNASWGLGVGVILPLLMPRAMVRA